MKMTHHLALIAGYFSSWDCYINFIGYSVLAELCFGRKDWQESFFSLQKNKKQKKKPKNLDMTQASTSW